MIDEQCGIYSFPLSVNPPVSHGVRILDLSKWEGIMAELSVRHIRDKWDKNASCHTDLNVRTFETNVCHSHHMDPDAEYGEFEWFW